LSHQVAVIILRIIIIALLGGLAFLIYMGRREMIFANQLPFFEVKRKRIARGWRLILIGVFLGLMAAALQFVGMQVIDNLLPQVATPAVAGLQDEPASPASTGTATRPPANTATPSITPSQTERGTPSLPQAVVAMFEESVTPDALAVFGPLHVTSEVLYPAYPDEEQLESAQGILYGLFSYDYLEPGVRWTAVWLWENDIICVDTKPWDAERGGWGYTECELDVWPAGDYFIHIFLGEQWMISGEFEILGSAE
jgi:hypothetical protein